MRGILNTLLAVCGTLAIGLIAESIQSANYLKLILSSIMMTGVLIWIIEIEGT